MQDLQDLMTQIPYKFPTVITLAVSQLPMQMHACGYCGWSRYNSVGITNCYYLTGTAGQVYGHGTATVTNTTEKSAFDFANGGVLALLRANRPADAQPWDTTCKYLESAGMTPAGICQAKPDRPRPCVEHLHDRHCGQDPHPQLCLRRCGDRGLHHHPRPPARMGRPVPSAASSTAARTPASTRTYSTSPLWRPPRTPRATRNTGTAAAAASILPMPQPPRKSPGPTP